MLTQNKIPRSAIIFGLLLIGTLIISACSSQPAPAATQEEAAATEEALKQVAELTPTEAQIEVLPTAVVEELPVVPTEEQVVETGEDAEGYPAPGYQFPTPATDAGAYPYPSPGQSVPPALKTGLEATNPSSVVLATGKPQLIEFFAFW